MRPEQHHGDGAGSETNGANQDEGEGGGFEDERWWWRRCRRRWCVFDCNVDRMMSLCRRKPHWPTVLSVLGMGWLVATFLTGYGMYMVICHSPTQHLQVFSSHNVKMRQVVAIEKGYISSGGSTCGGSWTLREGQVTLILGCLLNGFVLALMLFTMFLDRRHPHTSQIQEQPPDYETLIKEETPPPSYNELYSSSSSSSCSISTSSSTVELLTSQTPPPAYKFLV